MNALAQTEAHLQQLLEQKEMLEAEIAGHLTNAITRKAAGNTTGALSHLRRKKMKSDRMESITTMIAQTKHVLQALRKATGASKPPSNEIDRVSAILSKSLLPEVSQEELNAALREAEHATYLKNMERGVANAAAEAKLADEAAVAPVPGSAASYKNSANGTTLPPVVRPMVVSGPAPVNPGVPMISPYPVRVGGKSRRRYGRLSKSRRRGKKTIRRRR
jgi:uncharacterized protein YdcH (DUF465 family)